MGQYSMHAGEPAQPVQQSVVIARMRGLFLRAAFPSPSDIGQCFSTMSNIQGALKFWNFGVRGLVTALVTGTLVPVLRSTP
ncbi:MAG TPA: hypothetical protein VIG25_01085, partial [Pyrinomonadaceae bacterium]